MKERVAKMLFGWMHGHERWDDADPYEREDCMEAAGAAIEAMREPSDGMLQSARVHGQNHAIEIRQTWADMIDEALK